MTRLQVAGLLREPPGTIRAVDVGSLGWVDPSTAGGRPLLGTLRLQRTNRGILASGRLRTVVRRTCIRCLDEFDEPVDFSLEEEFLPSLDPKTGKAVVVDPEDVVVARIDSHHEIDFGPVIADELALAEPMQPLCRPDCRGLCPTCGLRLEDGSHDHDGGEVDPRLASLADWKPPTD